MMIVGGWSDPGSSSWSGVLQCETAVLYISRISMYLRKRIAWKLECRRVAGTKNAGFLHVQRLC